VERRREKGRSPDFGGIRKTLQAPSKKGVRKGAILQWKQQKGKKIQNRPSRVTFHWVSTAKCEVGRKQSAGEKSLEGMEEKEKK